MCPAPLIRVVARELTLNLMDDLSRTQNEQTITGSGPRTRLPDPALKSGLGSALPIHLHFCLPRPLEKPVPVLASVQCANGLSPGPPSPPFLRVMSTQLVTCSEEDNWCAMHWGL